jgi:hypothetical protein
VTLRDLEQMAQQSSPQIVQARAVQASGAVRLIAVGRAPDVQPKSAQLRALRQFLLERTSPLLAADGRLQVVAPELIQLRLNVRLLVTELESTGRLQQAVSAALRAFFDAASGGSDGTGWPLGAVPTVTDVAAVLVDLADSAGLDTVEFARRLPNDDVVALPARLRPDQLIVLAPADIEIRFAIDNAEVQA